MILAAVAVMVLALSVPAIGSSTDWFGLAKKASKTAKKASKRSKQAKKQAKKAKTKAREANQTAKSADASASQANQKADQLEGELGTTKIVSASVSGTITSSAPIGSYEAKGGPSVRVTVPSSGLIEVWAQADILDDVGGAVGLYEDGQKVPNISDEEFCGDDSALIDMQGGGSGEFETFSTPPTAGVVLGCTNEGAPSPVLLQRPPGQHTYELRYSECSCGGTSTFRNRVLRVGPRL